MRGLLITALCVAAQCVVAAPAAASQVLGAEAAAPVRAWVGRLEGLQTRGIRIDRSAVSVSLGASCELHVVHTASSDCPGGASVGDARACLAGDACPAPAKLEAALSAAGPLTLPWKTGGAEGSRDEVLGLYDQLRRHLEVGERAEARALLESMLARPDVRPFEWPSLLPIAPAVGLKAAAFKLVSGDAARALDTGSLALLRVLLLRGPDLAAAVAPATVDRGNACALAAAAVALQWVGEHDAAGHLAHAARLADPTCFDAYAAESESWVVLEQVDALDEVAKAAVARFPDHPRLPQIEEPWLILAGQGQVVLERLEARLRGGDRSPGLLKRLLSFYIAVEGRKERLERLLQRSREAPEDGMASFFAGVLLHYEKDHAASQAQLVPLIEVFPKEPRLYIYLAMNAFNLGDRAAAERWIGVAQSLDLRDPDVPYCTAEIYRDSDRERALAALETYLAMVAATANPDSIKERRVRAMKVAIERCVRDKAPVPCQGPWEHTFDSVRLARERAGEQP